MQTYQVALTRTYLVTISAESEDLAKEFVEYYLGNCPDVSNEKEKIEKNFSIEDIELVYNEADEIVAIMD